MAKEAGTRFPEKAIPAKIVDDTIILNRPRRGAKLREEVWQTADGAVTNLVCRVDKGRVLGCDNSHDGPHRHFMGQVEPVAFTNYKSLAKRFQE